MDRHPLATRELSLAFKAIDDEATHRREDAFAIREMPYGFDLYIASIVPTASLIEKLSLSEMLRCAPERKKRKEWSLTTKLDSKGDKAYGLTRKEGSLAVVVRYVVSKLIGIQGTDLSVGMVRLTHVLTPKEYLETKQIQEDSERIKKMLDELFISDEDRRRQLESYTETDKVHQDIRLGLISLFSYACRLAAIKEKVPFIGVNRTKEKYFVEFSPLHAVFSRPLRDPLGFINLTNLSQVLQGYTPYYSLEKLRSSLEESR